MEQEAPPGKILGILPNPFSRAETETMPCSADRKKLSGSQRRALFAEYGKFKQIVGTFKWLDHRALTENERIFLEEALFRRFLKARCSQEIHRSLTTINLSSFNPFKEQPHSIEEKYEALRNALPRRFGSGVDPATAVWFRSIENIATSLFASIWDPIRNEFRRSSVISTLDDLKDFTEVLFKTEKHAEMQSVDLTV